MGRRLCQSISGGYDFMTHLAYIGTGTGIVIHRQRQLWELGIDEPNTFNV